MPGDALQALQCLAQHLGRAPTLVELYQYLGADPSGTPQGPGPDALPSAEPPEMGDGRLTALVSAHEAMDRNPEIRLARDELIRRLLFGDFGASPSPRSLLGPPRHGPQGGKPFYLGPHQPLSVQ